MPEPPASPGSRDWRGSAPRGPARAPRAPRRGKLVFVIVIMLLLAGSIAGVIYWISPIPEPHFVAIWIDQYQDAQVPVNPWAAQDRQALLAIPWHEKNAFARQERHLLLAELNGLHARADKPVVIYLDAFAVSGDNGELYVLPGDARLDTPATWLKLAEILTLVRECRAEYKLLILDLTHPLTAPRLGLLVNDAAERAHAAVEAALKEDPRLLVLCSCSPGQVSLDLEDAGHSLFGYYLRQGLSGRADGYNEQETRDGRVSARELAAFVRARVDRWAERNRGARQTPVLLGAAGDFPLVGARDGSPSGSDAAEALETYPDWLRAGWTLLDEWRAGTAARVPPETYRQLETTLLRAEQHWRGGTKPDDIRTVLQTVVDRFQRQRDERAAAGKKEPRSLAQALAQGQKPPDLAAGDLPSRFRDLAELDARVQAVKPDEKDKEKGAKDKEKLAAGQKEFLKKLEGKPFDLSWMLFQTVVEEPALRPEHVRAAADLLVLYPREKPGAVLPSFAEVRFLQRLGEWTRTVKENWPGGTVHDALQVVREAERAAVCDPSTLPWIRDLRDGAGRKQREGERLLLDRDPASWSKAGPLLRECLREYQLVNQAIKIIEEAQRCRDEALALLPGYAHYLEHDRSNEEVWEGAVDSARTLQQVLSRPEGKDPFTDVLKKMDDLTATLRDQLNKLAQPLTPDRLKRMIAQAEHAGPAAGRELNAVLACPWLNVPDRVALWKALRAHAGRLHQQTVTQDQAEDRVRKATAAPSAFDSAGAGRQERRRALARARDSITLLKLERGISSKELDAALARTTAEPANPAAWQALARELRRAWQQP